MSSHAVKTTYPECDCGGCTNQNQPFDYVPKHECGPWNGGGGARFRADVMVARFHQAERRRYVSRHSSDLPPVGMVGGSDVPPNAAPTTGLPVAAILAGARQVGGAASSAALGRLDAANTNGAQR